MPDLVLMTWNMLHAPGDRADALYDVIAEHTPDLVAAQEINEVDGAVRIGARLGMTFFLGSSNRPESPGASGDRPVPEHVGLFSRLPIRRAQVHPGDRDAMFRGVLETWVDVPGLAKPLGVFVVHLRALPGPEGSAYRMREIASLRTVLADACGPHMVVGDFNAFLADHVEAWGGLPEWGAGRLPEDHRRAVRGEAMERLMADGYQDVLADRTGVPPSPSLRGAKAPRVDHILVTPDLLPFVEDARVLRSDRIEEASDHYPCIVRLRLPVPDAPRND